jgi:hypothetical protein
VTLASILMRLSNRVENVGFGAGGEFGDDIVQVVSVKGVIEPEFSFAYGAEKMKRGLNLLKAIPFLLWIDGMKSVARKR